MIGKFNDAFKKKKPSTIPAVLIDIISAELPKGFKYVELGEDTLILTPEETDRVKIAVPDFLDSVPIEANITNASDFALYLYNAQESLELKDNKLSINGKIFDIEQLIKRPFFEGKIKNQIILRPDPLPEPITIELASEKEDYKLELTWKRLPHKSVNVQKYKIDGLSGLDIYVYLNLSEDSLSMDLKYNFKNADSVKQLLQNLKVIRSFKENTALINGDLIRADATLLDEQNVFIDSAINFWNKVFLLEDLLNVHFNTNSEINLDDMIWIERIYQSFINNIGTKKYINISAFDLTTSALLEETEQQRLQQKGTLLSFTHSCELTLLGVSLNLILVTSWYDYIICDIKLKENIEEPPYKYSISLKPMTSKGLIEFSTFFKDDIEADKYIQDTNLVTQKYNEASFITDLLQNISY